LAAFDLPKLAGLLYDPPEYAAELTRALFQSEALRTAFARARASAQSQRVPLRLRVFVGASTPELHSTPCAGNCCAIRKTAPAWRLSRDVDAYKSPSPAARAAKQWIEAGKSVAPGQVMQFVITRGKPGVWAYGLGELDVRRVDVERYIELLERAAGTVLDVFSARKA
jgi:hypothetical protein